MARANRANSLLAGLAFTLIATRDSRAECRVKPCGCGPAFLQAWCDEGSSLILGDFCAQPANCAAHCGVWCDAAVDSASNLLPTLLMRGAGGASLQQPMGDDVRSAIHPLRVIEHEAAPTPRRAPACTVLEVILTDAYGDGWQGNVLHVGGFTFTLEGGTTSEALSVCLEDGTYYPYACGGTHQEEVGWAVGTVSGGADDSCAGDPAAPLVVVTPTPRPTPRPTPGPTLEVGCSAKTCTEHGASWLSKMTTYGSPTVCAFSKVGHRERRLNLLLVQRFYVHESMLCCVRINPNRLKNTQAFLPPPFLYLHLIPPPPLSLYVPNP